MSQKNNLNTLLHIMSMVVAFACLGAVGAGTFAWLAGYPILKFAIGGFIIVLALGVAWILSLMMLD